MNAATRKRFCLVGLDFPEILRNGGIGTYNEALVAVLRSRGWDVHIVVPGHYSEFPNGYQALRDRYERVGVRVHSPAPGWQSRPRLQSPWNATTASALLESVREVHAQYPCDVIEVPDLYAPGLRIVQAARATDDFRNAAIVVRLHSPAAWHRQFTQGWMTTFDDARVDYAERLVAEHADWVASPSRHGLEFISGLGWAGSSRKTTLPYPFPSADFRVSDQREITEVVFFGRLEFRKGLDLFVQAAATLPAHVAITFLGRDVVLPGGQRSSDYIASHLKRPHQILPECGRVDALKYLQAGGRLAVIPSRAETFGYTVVECATNGIPFLAGRYDALPSVIGNDSLREMVSFDLHAFDGRPSLSDAVQTYLQRGPREVRELTAAVRDAMDPERHNRTVTAFYDEIRGREPARPHRRRVDGGGLPVPLQIAAPDPTQISALVVLHGDMDPTRCIQSIRSQSRPVNRILLAQARPNAIAGEPTSSYPQVATLGDAAGAAPNHYLLVVPSSAVLAVTAVERLAYAAAQLPEMNAWTAYSDVIDADGKVHSTDEPIGGPRITSGFDRTHGATVLLAPSVASESPTVMCTDALVFPPRLCLKVAVIPERLCTVSQAAIADLFSQGVTWDRRVEALHGAASVVDMDRAERFELVWLAASFDGHIPARPHWQPPPAPVQAAHPLPTADTPLAADARHTASSPSGRDLLDVHIRAAESDWQLLGELTTARSDREALLAERARILGERDRILADRATILADRNRILVELLAIREEREKNLGDRATILADRDRIQADLTAVLAGRGHAFDDRAAMLGEIDRHRAEIESLRADRDQLRVDLDRQRMSAAYRAEVRVRRIVRKLQARITGLA